MFGRNKTPITHRQKLMFELGRTYGSLRQAAGHFTGGATEHMGPTYKKARGMAGRGWGATQEKLGPLYQQMQEKAAMPTKKQGRRMMKNMKGAKQMKVLGLIAAPERMVKRKKWPIMAGLVVTGAAVGAASAAMRRRRTRAEWEEYDSMTGEPGRGAEHGGMMGDKMSQRVTAGAATMADTVSSRAGRLADNLHERTMAMQERDAARTAADSAEERSLGANGTARPAGNAFPPPAYPPNTPGTRMSDGADF